jgi:hypothetical protein
MREKKDIGDARFFLLLVRRASIASVASAAALPHQRGRRQPPAIVSHFFCSERGERHHLSVVLLLVALTIDKVIGGWRLETVFCWPLKSGGQWPSDGWPSEKRGEAKRGSVVAEECERASYSTESGRCCPSDCEDDGKLCKTIVRQHSTEPSGRGREESDQQRQ